MTVNYCIWYYHIAHTVHNELNRVHQMNTLLTICINYHNYFSNTQAIFLLKTEVTGSDVNNELPHLPNQLPFKLPSLQVLCVNLIMLHTISPYRLWDHGILYHIPRSLCHADCYTHPS